MEDRYWPLVEFRLLVLIDWEVRLLGVRLVGGEEKGLGGVGGWTDRWLLRSGERILAI